MIELTNKTDTNLTFKAKSEGIGKIQIDAIDAGNVVKTKTIYYIVKPITIDLEYDDTVELYKGDTVNVKINTNADSYNVIFNPDLLEVQKGDLENFEIDEGSDLDPNARRANVGIKLLQPSETNAVFNVIRNNETIHSKTVNLKINDIFLDVICDPIHVRINDNFNFQVVSKGADRFNINARNSARLMSVEDGNITMRVLSPGAGTIEVQAIKNGVIEKTKTIHYEVDDIYIKGVHDIIDVPVNSEFEFKVDTNADHFEVKLNGRYNELISKDENSVRVKTLDVGENSVFIEAYQMIDGEDTLMKRAEIPFKIDYEGYRYDFTVNKDGENVDLFKGINLDNNYIIYINNKLSDSTIKSLTFNAGDRITIRRKENNTDELFPMIQDTSYIKDFYLMPKVSIDLKTPVNDFTSLFEKTEIETVSNNLFKYNPQVVVFDNVFFNCENLKAIPEDLFKYNTSAYSFNSAFERCKNIVEIPSNLFNYIQTSNTIVFDDCFTNCENVTGKLPTLWLRYPNAKHDYCFSGLNKASNINDAIRNNWA
jgi:hypothetical protein